MNFIADLHVHSKFSRATAKNLDLENMYVAAQLKGITVLGTGDFTHPGWFSEICEKLVPAEQGLFKLKENIARACDEKVFPSCRQTVRFVLTSEISNIYKKGDRTRKNHNLIFLPDLDAASRFNEKLDAIGNITSDGRPILGLDARNLLEILLDTSDQGLFIPAHIWTPWFSLLGSKSGFDSIEECFSDLTPNIFAIETGLSSDPAMNWLVSCLDNLTLISNSDAHSPMNLGREANMFDTKLSYSAIMSAIKTGDPGEFLGTIEFYPEEGKYHLDGHRKCNVCFWPEKTRGEEGICPECGRPLIMGVLNRVEELSDRQDGEKPEKSHPYVNMIPLAEILSELFEVGPKTKRVQQKYNAVLKKLGPELKILHLLEKGEIDSSGIPLLGEAIERMRRKEVVISPGYDGKFGTITIFTPEEKMQRLGQKSLFKAVSTDLLEPKPPKRSLPSPNEKRPEKKTFHPAGAVIAEKQKKARGLNEKQRRAVEHEKGPMIIVAGPGTGKTRTITHRIAYLTEKKGISAKNILAVTFTNKAAREMRTRLKKMIKNNAALPFVATFHSFCFTLLSDEEIKTKKICTQIIPEEDRLRLVSAAAEQAAQKGFSVTTSPKILLNKIISAKQKIVGPDDPLESIAAEPQRDELALIYETYQDLLDMQGLYDYEDLIFKIVKRLENDREFCKRCQDRFEHIFIDEYQDINYGQYKIIRALSPQNKNLCVIGDPDQSIYGFRGSDVRYFERFLHDYPNAVKVQLSQNYRSTESILEASYQVIKDSPRPDKPDKIDERIYSGIEGEKTIHVLELKTQRAEAVAVGKAIETMVGGMGFHFMDFNRGAGPDKSSDKSSDSSSGFKTGLKLGENAHLGFSDFAVLYRTHAQGKIFSEVFESAGIPYQTVSRTRVFFQKGIPEIVSFLRIIEGYGSFADLYRLFKQSQTGIGAKTIAVFYSWCCKHRFSIKDALSNARRFPIPGMTRSSQLKLNEFIGSLINIKKDLKEISVEKKLRYIGNNTEIQTILEENPKAQKAFNKLLSVSDSFGNQTVEFLAHIALFTDTDAYDENAQRVSLMTMHAAKGLEFPVVFIVGCDAKIIPFKRKNGEPVDIEEERRLFYVAMTRAKQRLYLTHSKQRRMFGQNVTGELSPFVSDIEKRLRNHETPGFKKKKKYEQKQMSLF